MFRIMDPKQGSRQGKSSDSILFFFYLIMCENEMLSMHTGLFDQILMDILIFFPECSLV